MHRRFPLYIVTISFIFLAGCGASKPGGPMKLTSSAFQHEGMIPSQYTCDGGNTSPPLGIEDVSQAAKSLVLIVDDPDAPAGTWLHWTVWNIDPGTTRIKENSVPKGGVEGLTGFGKSGYGGPCPPEGLHRYFFKLHALDTMLDLKQGARLIELQRALDGHIIASAELMGTYLRD